MWSHSKLRSQDTLHRRSFQPLIAAEATQGLEEENLQMCFTNLSHSLQWSKPQGLWLFTRGYWGVTSNVPILRTRKCNPGTNVSPRRTCENRRLCRRSGSSTTITEGQRRSNDEGVRSFGYFSCHFLLGKLLPKTRRSSRQLECWILMGMGRCDHPSSKQQR